MTELGLRDKGIGRCALNKCNISYKRTKSLVNISYKRTKSSKLHTQKSQAYQQLSNKGKYKNMSEQCTFVLPESISWIWSRLPGADVTYPRNTSGFLLFIQKKVMFNFQQNFNVMLVIPDVIVSKTTTYFFW